MMKRILILIVALLILTGCAAPIGTVQGPEWDVITIDGVEYVKAYLLQGFLHSYFKD